MQVTMSKFLTDKKSLLKQLLTLLSKDFKYVSILGADTYGKQYSVKKTGISVNDSTWTERGFVVRVHNGINYSEFSFNNICEENLQALCMEIKATLEDTIHKFKQTNTPISAYPIFEEEAITKNFLGEVKILPQAVTAKEKLEKMTKLKDSAFAFSDLLVDFRVSYEEVHISKIFLSNKKELEQSYIWSQGTLLSIVRRDENTKYSYKPFSGLKAVEL